MEAMHDEVQRVYRLNQVVFSASRHPHVDTAGDRGLSTSVVTRGR
jgi:hypothetical protein